MRKVIFPCERCSHFKVCGAKKDMLSTKIETKCELIEVSVTCNAYSPENTTGLKQKLVDLGENEYQE